MARGYDNSGRVRAARQTRRRILAAAHELIVRDGYRALSIAGLAEAAEVSPQTIYNAIGNKAAVLKACYDVTLAGDDEPVAMSDRPAFRAIREAATAIEFVVAYARWSRIVYEHVGELVGATLFPGDALDGGAGEFAATIDRERRIGTTHAITAYLERFGGPEGSVPARVIDAVWVLNAPEVYDRLVRRSGWTLDQYEQWLVGQLAVTLGATTPG